MKSSSTSGLVVVSLSTLLAMSAAVAPTACSAQTASQNGGHDSNTLHKIGKSIQYTTHKDAGNVSVATHRALNKNSVTHRKVAPNVRQDKAITPGGHLKPAGPKTGSVNP